MQNFRAVKVSSWYNIGVCAPVLEEFYYDIDKDVNENKRNKCLINLHLIYTYTHIVFC